MIGITRLATRELTTAANARPMTKATASSIRFPRRRKSLNSFSTGGIGPWFGAARRRPPGTTFSSGRTSFARLGHRRAHGCVAGRFQVEPVEVAEGGHRREVEKRDAELVRPRSEERRVG